MNQLTNPLINHLTQILHSPFIILHFLLDCLFPKLCVGCGQEGEWICAKCWGKIVLIKQPTCPGCNRLTRWGQFCQRCREDSFLTGVITAAYYEDGPLKEAIHVFKYGGVFDLAKDLGRLLRNKLNLKTFTKCNKVRVVLIPVPLHKKRKAQRGYNQSELLAKQLKTKDGKLKTEDLKQKNKKTEKQRNKETKKQRNKGDWQLITNKLIRIKQTNKAQVELSGKARRENVQGIFTWRGHRDELKGKIVFLVDDVYTTGATLQECAKILRQQAGAKQVWGIVLAKA